MTTKTSFLVKKLEDENEELKRKLNTIISKCIVREEIFGKNQLVSSDKFLYICRHYKNKLKMLLSSDHINQEIFNSVNGGETCLHITCSDNPECIEPLLNSKYMTQKLFEMSTLSGKTCFSLVCYKHPKYIELLLNSKYMTQELFNKTDIFGNSCLYLLNSKDPKYLNLLLDSKYMTQKLFNKVTDSMNTILHKYSLNNPNYVQIILNSKYMTQEFFNRKNFNGSTCLHVASIYNASSLKLILNSVYMNQEFFNLKNWEECTVLHYIEYEGRNKKNTLPDRLNILLTSKYMNKELFNIKHTLIRIKGRYNSLTYKEIDGRYFTYYIPPNYEFNKSYMLYFDDEHLHYFSYKKSGDTNNYDSKKDYPNYNEMKREIEEIKRAVDKINNFMFKMYCKPNGIYYRKINEKIDDKAL